MALSENAITKQRAYPLGNFPPEKQAEIAAAVEQKKPPPKWMALGPSDSHRPLAWIPSRAWYEWHWQRGIDPDARRPAIPVAVRRAVLERDGMECQLCGGEVEEGDVHLDHIVPYSHGGPDTVANLQVSHSRCNMRKGARV